MPNNRPSSPNLHVSQASLQDALLRAMRKEAGRAALRVSPGVQPEAQRLVFAVLREAATVKGGSLLEITPDDWLLTELPADEAGRMHALLAKILGETAVHVLPLPASNQILAGLLTASRQPQLLDVPATEPISPLGLDARLDRLNLAEVFRRRSIVGITDPSMPRLVLQRLELETTSLHKGLGALAEDRALLRHARALLQQRMLEALGDQGTHRSVMGGSAIAPLLLDLAPEFLPAAPPAGDEWAEAAGPPALYATLALHEAISVSNLAARREALAREAWGIAISGLSASALSLVDAEALPADWLILEWSPALEDAAAQRALRRLDPGRLIMDRCDGEAALSWGLSQGIHLYGGSWIEDVIAAGRMDHCAAAARCTRIECRTRGLATSPAGRLGCHLPHLLEAVLPEAPP